MIHSKEHPAQQSTRIGKQHQSRSNRAKASGCNNSGTATTSSRVSYDFCSLFDDNRIPALDEPHKTVGLGAACAHNRVRRQGSRKRNARHWCVEHHCYCYLPSEPKVPTDDIADDSAVPTRKAPAGIGANRPVESLYWNLHHAHTSARRPPTFWSWSRLLLWSRAFGVSVSLFIRAFWSTVSAMPEAATAQPDGEIDIIL